MSDFRFEAPSWSAALWVVLIVGCILLWLELRRGLAIARFLSITMQPRLVARLSVARRAFAILFLMLGAAALVIALMRPQYGLTYVKTPRVGAQIMFCLDVSKSMLAEDVAPNRLERAKADIVDLLTFLNGDQVGLIGFAGRATVLCPLTPDYGFFKLMLAEAGPTSVGRGGTRLEEPLRKAMDGFRTESDVSRVVFLITDGEDQGSRPLELAREAIERGITVVAVGLGDESGSEILISDPRTGVATPVLDAEGKPVITRLDGEMLRELALATEGVYIPAGTGTLDLQSIYESHLRPLVRGEMQDEGRAVRREAFQWALLVGLIFLLIAVLVGSGRVGQVAEHARAPNATGVVMVAILLSFTVSGDPRCFAAEADAKDASSRSMGETSKEAGEEALDGREIYNRGLEQLREDADAAERLLIRARNGAGRDGEVRYRATYNLGWVEVRRANESLEQEPQQSLEHLERAAGWFRDAIRLRSDAEAARHNLEVVLRRIRQLRDQLAANREHDLESRLDAIIDSERKVIAQARVLVERVARSEDPNVADEFRTDFRRLAVDQRVVLSDLQGLVEQAASEVTELESATGAEPSPEDGMRVAQLDALLDHLNQGSQRIGQSRSQLRRRQASRGFRRATTGLNQLKRARDQLRDPLQILDALVSDLAEVAQQTTLKSVQRSGLDLTTESSPIPSWIDQDYLVENQTEIGVRCEELTRRLQAGLQNQSPASVDEADGGENSDQEDFLRKLAAAVPHLADANDALGQAQTHLTLAEFDLAQQDQVLAIKSLQQAREQFADLRTLIDLTHAAQQEIVGVTQETVPEAAHSSERSTVTGESPDPDETEAEEEDSQKPAEDPWDPSLLSLVVERQAENLERLGRLQEELAQKSEQLQGTSTGASSESTGNPDQAAGQVTANPDSDRNQAERQRLSLAIELAARAGESMRAVQGSLSALEKTSDPAMQGTVNEQANDALKHLDDLRRLFFTVVEHLKDTAEKQAELNDETEQLAGMTSQSPSQMPPENDLDLSAELAERQRTLTEKAGNIADVLSEQSAAIEEEEQLPEAQSQQQALLKQNAERAGEAAELVSLAQEQMETAQEKLEESPAKVSDSRPPQDEALKRLIEAIHVLQPPQDDSRENDPQQNGSQDQQQQEQQDQGESEANQEPEEGQMDPARVLQAVRDREAQRRRDQDRRRRATQIPVEKDW